MINTEKVRAKHFWFYRHSANLLFFKRHSNLFLVFLDSKHKHIVTLTSGSCKIGTTKKQKISPLNMGGLLLKLKTYLTLYKIQTLRLIIRQRIPYFLRRLKKLFKFYNINISDYLFILKRRHGYKRGRTPRRV